MPFVERICVGYQVEAWLSGSSCHHVVTLTQRSQSLGCCNVSVEQLEFLLLSSLTDWINVSNCMVTGATIAFNLLSTSLEDIPRSSRCDYKLCSPSLADSPLWSMNFDQLSSWCFTFFRHAIFGLMEKTYVLTCGLNEYVEEKEVLVTQICVFTTSKLWELQMAYWYSIWLTRTLYCW